MPAPLVWLAWVGGLALAKWYTLSIGFHGGDHKAAWKSVSKKITAGAESAAATALDSAKFMKDFAIVSTALVQLQNSSDFQTVIKGCHALKRAMASLPEETITGLNKVFSLSDYIEEGLRGTVHSCGLTVVQNIRPENAVQDLQQIYFGLYLVGRSGSILEKDQCYSSIQALMALHQECGDRTGNKIQKVLEDFKPEDPTVLTDALSDYLPKWGPGESSIMPAVYITKALGGDIIPTQTIPLIDEIVAMFPEEE